jgi:hypothetical protein
MRRTVIAITMVIGGAVLAGLATAQETAPEARAGQAEQDLSRKRGVMLMNRIAPSSLELYVANADGSGERKFLENSTFDYHATWSPSGKWVVFTSERNGDGRSDIFRCRPDGTSGNRTGPLVVVGKHATRRGFSAVRGRRRSLPTSDFSMAMGPRRGKNRCPGRRGPMLDRVAGGGRSPMG